MFIMHRGVFIVNILPVHPSAPLPAPGQRRCRGPRGVSPRRAGSNRIPPNPTDYADYRSARGHRSRQSVVQVKPAIRGPRWHEKLHKEGCGSVTVVRSSSRKGASRFQRLAEARADNMIRKGTVFRGACSRRSRTSRP